MNVLIVHAHHEPRSFSSALKDRAAATLTALGHEVEVSDLYAMGFDPVSDRRNFTTVADPVHLKQQREETFASTRDGFVPALAAEMEKVLRADVLVFNFPLWWFAMPAILKGWVDRVFAYGTMYGGGKLYENGVGRGKRALVTLTTGGGPGSYSGFGFNTPMSTILAPIHHGIFWFNGFAPLPPFLAYEVARISSDARATLLEQYDRYLRTLEDRAPYVLPPLRDFDPDTDIDRFGRWMIDVDATELDRERIATLERRGNILAWWSSSVDDPSPATRLIVRAQDRPQAMALVASVVSDADTAYVVRSAAARPEPALAGEAGR